MFYPVDSLKRGGRFYLCWVADSWPLRFATITHRQLWSQDIRKICDDLIEVMTNESGRPANRFSLRLSSQLMRGLVRLYQRKVTVFLGDLCMINANVTKNVNKKWNIAEVVVDITHHRLPHPAARLEIQEEPEIEQRIEDIIQNSGNIVSNIQDITLKESVIPELLLPPNDGFGEENPDLQLLRDQTIEMMLVDDKSAHHSALGVSLNLTDKSHNKTHDKTHDKSRAHDAQMEPISELDATIFRKSVGDERLTMGGFEKDVPEIPEILLPELPVCPPPEMQVVEEPHAPVEPPASEPPKQPEEPAVEIELEELEQGPQTKRRRLKNKLIIDKKIKLTADYLVARIENTHVELRCEESADDIADTRLPVDILFRRPTSAGARLQCNISATLVRLFQRNLGVVARLPHADREMEEIAAERTSRVRTRSVLERIEEEPTAVPVTVQVEVHMEPPMPEMEASKDLNVSEPQNVTMPVEQVDISDLPTQKILMMDSQSRKRTSEYDISPKRQRLSGYVSFRQSQQLAIETSVPINEAEKENMPGAANIQTEHVDIPMCDANVRPSNAEKSLTLMLEEAGLADLPTKVVEEQVQDTVPQIITTQRVGRRGGSESSETPLGSLDRTKVSLGDSEQTTDSKRFIRDQWGTEGTMVKILRHIKVGLRPLTVKKLITKGPVMAGYKSIMAARCFTSILKLKQHGFVIINKDPETLEIKDIIFGPKFDHIK